MPLILNPYAFASRLVAFQTSADSDQPTITCPTVSQGDIGVLFDTAGNLSTPFPSNSIPSGFTQLQTSTLSGFTYRTTLSYKVFTGSEGGGSLSGLSGTSSMAKVLLVFRPNFAVAGVGVSTFLQETTQSAPSSQLIGAAGQTAPLIRLAVCINGAAASVPSFTSGTFDATQTRTGADSGMRAGYAIQNAAPTDDTVASGDNGNGNCLVSGWMNFT
jgi:hypothetical protein